MAATLGLATLQTEADLSGLNRDLRQGEQNTKAWLGSVSTSAAAVGATAIAGIGAAVGAIGAVGVMGSKAFIGFENQMNEVFTLLPGITQTAMDDMSADVLQFSKDFRVLPEQVVPALYQSLSAGVPADNVFSFLEVAQKAAVGGVTELETAVDGITSVVNAYGSDVLSAATASDVMFTAVRLGKTDFSQLSSSLFNVIPSAASLGISFEEVAAALATVTAQGTPTSVATTQLRALFTEASKSGSKLDTTIRELTGKGLVDLVAEGSTVTDVLQNVRSSLGDEEFRNLFGSVEALGVALGITGPNIETMTGNLDAMNNAAGATDAAFTQMETGRARFVEGLRAFGQVLLIQVGQALDPFMGALATLGETIFPKIESVLNGVVLPALETLSRVFRSLLLNLDMKPLDNFIEAIWDIAPPEVLDFLMRLRDEILPSLVEWFQANIQPLIDLAAGFVSWQDVLAALGILLAVTIIPILASIVASIIAIAAPIVAIIAVVALLRNAWEDNWGGIQEKTQAVLTFIQNLITTIMTGIQTFWAEHGEAIKTKANEIWEGIKVIYDTAFANIRALFNVFKAAFRGDWYEFGRGLREIWDNNWTLIKNIMANFWATIRPILANLAQNMLDFFFDKDWGEIGRNILQGIAQGILNGIAIVQDAAAAAAQAALDAAKGFLGIESPSKVARELVGKPFSQGIAAGVKDDDSVYAAVKRLVDLSMIEPLTGVSSNSQSVYMYNPSFNEVNSAKSLLEEFGTIL